jgi:hypothetical protein
MADKDLELKDALELIEKIPVPSKPLDENRKRTAANVAMNSEWDTYVANRLDALRAEALLEGMGDVTPEQLGASLLSTRGAIEELGRAHKFFRSCKSSVDQIANKTITE